MEVSWNAHYAHFPAYPVGPQHREVMTKFGSVLKPRTEAFDRKSLRQSNAITAHREIKGMGLFAGATESHLNPSLVPGRNLGKGMQVTTQSRLLDTSAPDVRGTALEYRSHHPPPSARPPAGSLHHAQLKPSALAGNPYAWKPNHPESVTYGFHRRW